MPALNHEEGISKAVCFPSPQRHGYWHDSSAYIQKIMAKLTFALEDGQEVIVPLTERLTLGRGDDNDVVVNDDSLALQHAEILPHASGSFELRDLGSTTGTFVNEQRVQTCRLIQGDRLTFGTLTAVLDLEAPADTLPSPSAKAALTAEAVEAVEKQLSRRLADVQEAEATHEQWLTTIAALTQQCEEKTTTLQQLNADLTAAQGKLTTLATRQQEETTRLQRLQHDATQAETRLAARNEEISTAGQTLTRLEQRRTQLEASLLPLGATVEKLAQEQRQHETSLAHLRADLQTTESQLVERRRALATETRLLEETQRRRTELEKQCQTLATQQRIESAPLPSKPAPVAPPPASTPPPPNAPAALRPPRIVAIDSPRFTVIPMKSERVVKRTTDAPTRKGS